MSPRLEEALLGISWYEATSAGTVGSLEAMARYEDVFNLLRVKLRTFSPCVEDEAVDDFLAGCVTSQGHVQIQSVLQSVYGAKAGAEKAARLRNSCGQSSEAGALDRWCRSRSASASLWTTPCLASLRRFLLSREPTWTLAWRRILDTESRGRLPRQAFYKALQRVGYRQQLRTAWCQLDAGGRGYITLAELDWECATTLGNLYWALVSTYGGAERATRQVGGDRSYISTTSFRSLLRGLTVTSRADELCAALVCEEEPGAIAVDSLRWLDKVGFSLPTPPHLRAVPGSWRTSMPQEVTMLAKAASVADGDGRDTFVAEWRCAKLYREGMDRHQRFQDYGTGQPQRQAPVDGIIEACEQLHEDAKRRDALRKEREHDAWQCVVSDAVDIHAGRSCNPKVWKRLQTPRRDFAEEIEPPAPEKRVPAEVREKAQARLARLHHDHAVRVAKMEDAQRQKEKGLEANVAAWHAKCSARAVNVEHINRLYLDAKHRRERLEAMRSNGPA